MRHNPVAVELVSTRQSYYLEAPIRPTRRALNRRGPRGGNSSAITCGMNRPRRSAGLLAVAYLLDTLPQGLAVNPEVAVVGNCAEALVHH